MTDAPYAQQVTLPAPGSPPRAPPLPTILLVDDDALMLALLSELLCDKGELVCAADVAAHSPWRASCCRT
jgi:hypothetical protein